MRYVAFCRAINVSGKNMVKMADLKVLFTDLGFSDVSTYLQSGNVVFKTNLNSTPALEQKIEQAITAHLKLSVEIILRSQKEVQEIIAANPFTGQSSMEFLYVTMFKQSLDKEGVIRKEPDEKYSISERCIYLYCPNGYGRTKMNNTNLEKQFNISATTRNWKTITAIQEMLQ